MTITIFPSSISGTLKAPSSKSSMQRACAAALLTPGISIIHNFGHSNDEQAALNVIEKLGAQVIKADDEIVITSSEAIFESAFQQKNTLVNIGESGLSMRMFAPIAALFNYEITFTGEGSILNRPMDFFDKHLPELNARVTSNNGKLPITIKGPLKPTNIKVYGGLSSQFLTGLLFAFAKSCKAPVNISVENLQSRPYIDLTISVLNHFGFKVENKNYEIFTIHPREKLQAHSIKYSVESDWSNAAFLLVAAAVSGEMILSGNDLNSTQGDKNILNALRDCGATLLIDKDKITVKKSKLAPFHFDATHCPDLFPPLVALASYCNGTSTIKGVNRLLHKESNRALSLREEFKKLNVQIHLDGDVMAIEGGNQLKGAKVSSHNDHRIAMACAVAALGAKGATIIEDAEAVDKSYPDFFKDLKKLKVGMGKTG